MEPKRTRRKDKILYQPYFRICRIIEITLVAGLDFFVSFCSTFAIRFFFFFEYMLHVSWIMIFMLKWNVGMIQYSIRIIYAIYMIKYLYCTYHNSVHNNKYTLTQCKQFQYLQCSIFMIHICRSTKRSWTKITGIFKELFNVKMLSTLIENVVVNRVK